MHGILFLLLGLCCHEIQAVICRPCSEIFYSSELWLYGIPVLLILLLLSPCMFREHLQSVVLSSGFLRANLNESVE
jgi:hypothetical protein